MSQTCVTFVLSVDGGASCPSSQNSAFKKRYEKDGWLSIPLFRLEELWLFFYLYSVWAPVVNSSVWMHLHACSREGRIAAAGPATSRRQPTTPPNPERTQDFIPEPEEGGWMRRASTGSRSKPSASGWRGGRWWHYAWYSDAIHLLSDSVSSEWCDSVLQALHDAWRSSGGW